MGDPKIPSADELATLTAYVKDMANPPEKRARAQRILDSLPPFDTAGLAPSAPTPKIPTTPASPTPPAAAPPAAGPAPMSAMDKQRAAQAQAEKDAAQPLDTSAPMEGLAAFGHWLGHNLSGSWDDDAAAAGAEGFNRDQALKQQQSPLPSLAAFAGLPTGDLPLLNRQDMQDLQAQGAFSGGGAAERQSVRADLAQAERDQPWASRGGKVAGIMGASLPITAAGAALAPAWLTAMGIPGSMLLGAGEGATAGAIQGAGEAEPGERTKGAIEGGYTGAGLGFGLAGLTGLLGKGFKSLFGDPAAATDELAGELRSRASGAGAETTGDLLERPMTPEGELGDTQFGKNVKESGLTNTGPTDFGPTTPRKLLKTTFRAKEKIGSRIDEVYNELHGAGIPEADAPDLNPTGGFRVPKKAAPPREPLKLEADAASRRGEVVTPPGTDEPWNYSQETSAGNPEATGLGFPKPDRTIPGAPAPRAAKAPDIADAEVVGAPRPGARVNVDNVINGLRKQEAELADIPFKLSRDRSKAIAGHIQTLQEGGSEMDLKTAWNLRKELDSAAYDATAQKAGDAAKVYRRMAGLVQEEIMAAAERENPALARELRDLNKQYSIASDAHFAAQEGAKHSSGRPMAKAADVGRVAAARAAEETAGVMKAPSTLPAAVPGLEHLMWPPPGVKWATDVQAEDDNYK